MKRVALAIALVIATSSPVNAVTSLEMMIANATGIPRTIDAQLQARATIRVLEIQPYPENFEHGDIPLGEAEIIGENIGFVDPFATVISGWLNSPEHRTIMFDASYPRIGCAWDEDASSRYYFICLFAVGPLPNTSTIAEP